MKALRTLVSVLIALLLACAVAACSGEGERRSGQGGSEARALLAESLGPGHPLRSGRVEVALDLRTGSGGTEQRIAGRLRGPFVAADGKRLPSFALELDSDSGGVVLGAISTGRAAYITVAGQAFRLPQTTFKRLTSNYRAALAARPSSRRGAGAGRGVANELGISPADWLVSVGRVGEERVGDVATVRIGGRVEVTRLLADADRLLRRSASDESTREPGVPERIDAQTRAAIKRAVRRATLDVWVGNKDRTLRRIELRLVLAPGEQDTKRLGGLGALDLRVGATITELGQVKTVSAPRGARPLDDLVKAIAAAAESADSGRAEPSGAEPPPDGGAEPDADAPTSGADDPTADLPAEQRDYGRCITAAGEDLSKLQACISLLR